MSHLDLSYDHHFEARMSLPWWPWVGSQYAASAIRTMVVGESIYEWDEEDRELFNKRYALTTGLRETHVRHALRFKRNSPYVRNIERAIFGASSPKDQEKHILWTSVVYHNLVLEPLRDIEHRPSRGQLRKGWEEVLDLCGLLSVEQLLVYGVGSVRALREVARAKGLSCHIVKGPKVGRCAARTGLIDLDTSLIKVLFIRHPSEFFSWERWGRVIHENLVVQFDNQAGRAVS